MPVSTNSDTASTVPSRAMKLEETVSSLRAENADLKARMNQALGSLDVIKEQNAASAGRQDDLNALVQQALLQDCLPPLSIALAEPTPASTSPVMQKNESDRLVSSDFPVTSQPDVSTPQDQQAAVPARRRYVEAAREQKFVRARDVVFETFGK